MLEGVDGNERWNSPIKVGFEEAGARTVNGPFDALTCLTDLWPAVRGLKYLKGPQRLRARSMERPSKARAEFI